jgi:hypothetical protein
VQDTSNGWFEDDKELAADHNLRSITLRLHKRCRALLGDIDKVWMQARQPLNTRAATRRPTASTPGLACSTCSVYAPAQRWVVMLETSG